MYDNEENNGAANAVDKDLSTGNGAQTDNGEGWLKLEFGRNHYIYKIVVHYRFYKDWYDPSSFCFKSEGNFKSCVDKNTNADVSVYQGDVKQKSCGTLQLTYALERSDQIYTLICNAEGDTVILSKNTGQLVQYEVAVIGRGTIVKRSFNFEPTNFNFQILILSP